MFDVPLLMYHKITIINVLCTSQILQKDNTDASCLQETTEHKGGLFKALLYGSATLKTPLLIVSAPAIKVKVPFSA